MDSFPMVTGRISLAVRTCKISNFDGCSQVAIVSMSHPKKPRLSWILVLVLVVVVDAPAWSVGSERSSIVRQLFCSAILI